MNCQVELVTSSSSPAAQWLKGIVRTLFPGYTPAFDRIVGRRDSAGRTSAQLFAGLCDRRPAGILQMMYREFRSGIAGCADLVGVLPEYRSSDLALRLMRVARDATREVAAEYGTEPLGLVWLVERDESGQDKWKTKLVKMYETLGAQVRQDLVYRFDGQLEKAGESVVWWPFSDTYADIDTKELAGLLWKFGELPEEEFARRYEYNG